MTVQMTPEFYALADETRETVYAVSEWLKGGPITDAEAEAKAADALAGLRKRITALEAAHKADKAPHLAACRAVDAAYKPLIAAVTEAANRLKSRIQDRIAHLERQRQEEARKAREAAEAAAREAAAAAAAAAAAEHDIAAAVEAKQARTDAEEAAKIVAKIEAGRVKVSGNYTQRAVTLRKTRVAVLTDWRTAIKWARSEDQRHLALKAWLEQQASAALRHGAGAVPGFTIEERESLS